MNYYKMWGGSGGRSLRRKGGAQTGEGDLRKVVALLPDSTVQIDAVNRQLRPPGEGAEGGAALQIVQQRKIALTVGKQGADQSLAAFGQDSGQVLPDQAAQQLGGTVAAAGGVRRGLQGKQVGQGRAVQPIFAGRKGNAVAGGFSGKSGGVWPMAF